MSILNIFKMQLPVIQKQQSELEQREILINYVRGAIFGDSYWQLATNGYQKNTIVFHCINQIARACADIPILINVNGKDVTNNRNNPYVKLFRRPNPKQSYDDWMFDSVCYRLISGNTYYHLLQGDITGLPFGIELFRPDRVFIEVINGIPKRFVYNFNGKEYYYAIDNDTGMSDVLQVKTFHPTDDLYGLSPISVARLAITQNNGANSWGVDLLENSAMPGGLITLKDKGDNAPQPDLTMMQKIREQVSKVFSTKNNGKIAVLNADWNFQKLSFSPMDMDWINSKNSTAREICLAFGYPAMLLGLPEGATFNNVAEAKLALYEDTVIPILNTFLESLSHWLSEKTQTDIELLPDLDKVSALIPRRQVARENARLDVAAGIITPNEAREEIGYEEVDGGNDIMVPAGKLPLNFDMTGLDEQKFQQWLMNDGMDADSAKQLVKLAFLKK